MDHKNIHFTVTHFDDDKSECTGNVFMDMTINTIDDALTDTDLFPLLIDTASEMRKAGFTVCLWRERSKDDGNDI